jgi:hypothetical protein
MESELERLVDLRVEVCWLLVAPYLRVDNGNNGDWHTANRKLGAACAALVSAADGEEILVLYKCAVTSGLHVLHHEAILD